MASTRPASSSGQVGAGRDNGPRPSRASVGRTPRPRRIMAYWARVAGDGGELVGAGAVEQHHAGDLLGVLVGVGHGVRAADGVPDQDVRARARRLPPAGRAGPAAAVDPVLGCSRVVAPSLAGAVVGADPGGGADPVDDAGPGRGELAEAVEEHDGGAALAAAVEVEVVVAHCVGRAGGGVGASANGSAVTARRSAPTDGGREDDEDRRQQPTADGPSGCGASGRTSSRRGPASPAATPR